MRTVGTSKITLNGRITLSVECLKMLNGQVGDFVLLKTDSESNRVFLEVA